MAFAMVGAAAPAVRHPDLVEGIFKNTVLPVGKVVAGVCLVVIGVALNILVNVSKKDEVKEAGKDDKRGHFDNWITGGVELVTENGLQALGVLVIGGVAYKTFQNMATGN